jgi:nucleotide-binding universal stress UspA family protein
LDGSSLAEYVLPHVVAIATAFDAQITLLNVLEQPSASLRMPKADPLDWYLKKTEADTYLNVVKARLEACQLSVKTMLLEGHATEQIVELAHTDKADLLILSSHGEYSPGGWSVSNIVQQILQRIRTSTLIIRANESNTAPIGGLRYQRLLVPLDGSRRAGATLPIATALTQAHQAELLLVHVVSKPEMARQMPLTQEDEELMNRFVERNEAEGAKYLEQLQAHLPTNVQTRLLVSSNVAATLQDFSEQEQIDLLLVSAHGYSGEAKWPYGSVTSRFISNSTMPLLIVQDLPHRSLETARDDVTMRQSAYQ